MFNVWIIWDRVFDIVQNQQFESTEDCQAPGRTAETTGSAKKNLYFPRLLSKEMLNNGSFGHEQYLFFLLGFLFPCVCLASLCHFPDKPSHRGGNPEFDIATTLVSRGWKHRDTVQRYWAKFPHWSGKRRMASTNWQTVLEMSWLLKIIKPIIGNSAK